jgi:hypothetical protein
MTDKSWKALERRIAAAFGTRRTPLSGSNSGHDTDSDTLSDRYYIEAKLRSKLPFWAEFADTRTKARSEGKKPVLAFHKKGYPGTIVMLKLEDFLEMEQPPECNLNDAKK